MNANLLAITLGRASYIHTTSAICNKLFSCYIWAYMANKVEALLWSILDVELGRTFILEDINSMRYQSIILAYDRSNLKGDRITNKVEELLQDMEGCSIIE